MIEIMFGESEAGSMKMAKRCKDDNDEEVICLGFLLDIGDIRKPVDSIYRKELIYSMYAQEQWGRDEEMDRELRETGNTYCREGKWNGCWHICRLESRSGYGTVMHRIQPVVFIISVMNCRNMKMMCLL